MKKEFIYYLYSPGGNDTALVEENNFDSQTKKIINDKIMNIHHNIEQVGFVYTDKYKLVMAGGEFCGNATRSAAYYYLNGKSGEIDICVSDDMTIKAGIDEKGKAWAQIPVSNSKKIIKAIDNGIYEVDMNGIRHIILEENISKEYLLDMENIKENAMDILKKYKIMDSKALGVIFLEKKYDKIKIHPVVWVKSINTVFYETACGSGTIATSILQAMKENKNQSIDIIQPSNQIITSRICVNKGKVANACILGNIKTDNNARRLIIDI